MATVLFELGGTNTVSANFTAPAQISVFGMSEDTYIEDDGVIIEITCGDYIVFERLAYDGKYDINCAGIDENGIKASAPVLDDCCCEVKMDACNNVMEFNEKGIFRAIYHGDNRENILVIKE